VNPPDRRSANRQAIELSVEYKRLNTFFADYTRNISKGGTFIRTERPLDVATEFVFALTIRGLPEPLRLRGRVKWVVSLADATPTAPAGMGIEFVYVDEEERRATEGIVERLMASELGEGLAARLLGRKGSDEAADRPGPGAADRPSTAGPGAADRLAPGPADRLAPGPADRLAPGPADRLAPGPADRLAPGPADRPAPGGASPLPPPPGLPKSRE
jgi:type IV pilus assembly protein PilZ